MVSRPTEDRGLLLAKAFDEIIQSSSYGTQLKKKPRLERVPRLSLEELSRGVSLDNVPRKERDILLNAIMPPEPEDDERHRLENYSLLLWLTQFKGTAIEESDVFSAAQQVPRGVPDCLRRMLDSWLEYVIRDVIAVVHEAVFGAVMQEIDLAFGARGAPALAADVISALLNATDEHEQVLRQIGLLRRNEAISNLKFKQLRQRVQHACSDQENVSSGLRRWRGGLSETNLYTLALQSGRAAAVLLPVMWCLVAQRISLALREAGSAESRFFPSAVYFRSAFRMWSCPRLMNSTSRTVPFRRSWPN